MRKPCIEYYKNIASIRIVLLYFTWKVILIFQLCSLNKKMKSLPHWINNICCRFALVTFLTLLDTKTISCRVIPLILSLPTYIASSILINLSRVNWMQNLMWLIYFSAQYFVCCFPSIYQVIILIMLRRHVKDISNWFLDEKKHAPLGILRYFIINIKLLRVIQEL